MSVKVHQLFLMLIQIEMFELEIKERIFILNIIKNYPKK